ncbi:MAG TPA: hypothetical protein VFM11_01960 [Burkholderiales bacterium]|nr:hypothetical protein [Burkholderiales bacterium]
MNQTIYFSYFMKNIHTVNQQANRRGAETQRNAEKGNNRKGAKAQRVRKGKPNQKFFAAFLCAFAPLRLQLLLIRFSLALLVPWRLNR